MNYFKIIKSLKFLFFNFENKKKIFLNNYLLFYKKLNLITKFINNYVYK